MAKEKSEENTSGILALNNSQTNNASAPLCRCRVLYIGSAVPTVSKDGLQGIQQPLKERYPANENSETKGIDSWLSVWSNGLLLEYVDGTKRTESAFFPVVTLHYCAAVRYVNVSGFSIEGGGERFIPLDTPFAHIPNSPHPPIFAAIFRRTSGIKVLECHAFICTNERAANALVRCCFHSYANTIYLKIDEKMGGLNVGLKAIKETSSRSVTPISEANLSEQENNAAIDDMREESNWNERAIGQKTWQRRQQNGEYDSSSISSIMYKNRKNNIERKRQSSLYDNDRAVAPYIENRYTHTIRRGGSQPDVRDYCDTNYNHYERATLKEFASNAMPPPPPDAMRSLPLQGFMPRMMFGGYHPSFMMPTISPTASSISKKKSSKRSKSSKQMPPFFMPRSFAPPPPPAYLLPSSLYHGLPPMGRPGPYRPHVMPPRFYFSTPPPHNLMQFAMMERARNTGTFPSPDGLPAGSGPIITESIYDTFPRNRISQGTYEEPIYMPSNYGHHQDPTLSSSYKPENISPENYETFYETYRLRKKNNKKHGSGSDSDASEEGSNTDIDRACNSNYSNHRFWEAYEASVYRKTHINEKAFANSVIGAKTDQNNNNSIKFDAETSDKTQPHIPPADYDCDNCTQVPVRRPKSVSQDCRVSAY